MCVCGGGGSDIEYLQPLDCPSSLGRASLLSESHCRLETD